MKKLLPLLKRTPSILGLVLFILLQFNPKLDALSQGMNEIKISGTVTSEEEKTTLPGVNVMVKGTTNGTVTDIEGNFSLNVPKENTVLVFSYIGYTTKELLIGDRIVLNVSLNTDIQSLNEVVVVGYGTQKRENIIGSIAQVSAEQLENRPVTQLSNALSGQMAGVTVIQRSGEPGNDASEINVRGVGSFGATSGALVIVDGIPSSFNDIDPNDVASISVLKDASSAAIYGARAANGVILITTKTGQEGKMKVSYNGYVGFQSPTEFPDFVDSWEFAELFNEASESQAYSQEDIQKYRDGSDPDNFPNTDFLNAVFSKNGALTGQNLSFSGGTSTSQYVLSLGYLYQDGLVVKNNYDRYNVRLNLSTEINSKLTLTARLAGIRTSAIEPNEPATLGNNGGVRSIINHAVRYPPINPGILSNGDYGTGIVQKGTPISYLETDSFIQDRGMDIMSNIRLDYQVMEDLEFSLIAGYNQGSNNNKSFEASQRLNDDIFLAPNTLTLTNNTNYYYTVQGLAEYSRQIDKHAFGALLGYSMEENRFETMEAYRDGLPGNDLTELNVGSPENQQSSGTANEWGLLSQFGRVNYSYANKYLVEGVIRRDGSSRFPPDFKYAYFPSAAIGWRMGQESFIQNNFSWINELKLKTSIGVLGNQNIPNYPYQNTYAIGSSYNYPFGGSISQGVARTTITDPTLHWESTRTTDVGIELEVFDSKLNFSATYFDRYTYDILYSPGGSVSNTLGFNLSKQNTGKLNNSGWEFIIGHNNSIGEFNYNINGNFSIIKNEVLDLGVGNIPQPNGMIGNGSSLFIGHPMQIYYGYQADGIFVTEEEINNYPDQSPINPGAQPGDIRYKDISGPDGIPDGVVNATYDRVVLGSNIPKYTFGLNLTGNYKGFDINILLQGVAGVSGYMNGYAGYAFNNFGTVQKWQMEERWTHDNPRADAGYPRLELISNSGTPNTLESSFWTLNAAYLRAKNVQLGYTVSNTISQKIGIERVRIYASGENLLNISNFRKGWDPEVGNDPSANDDSNAIYSNGSYYPILRNLTFGLNINF